MCRAADIENELAERALPHGSARRADAPRRRPGAARSPVGRSSRSGAPRWSTRSSSMNSSHSSGPPSSSSCGAHRKLRRDRQVPAAPGAHMGKQRHELDRLFGQAVDRLLLVAGIVGLAEQAGLDQPLQPVGKDVRSDPLLRFGLSSSRKWRRLPNMMSRMTIRLQRSPSVSSVRLIGHPERCSAHEPM